MFEEFVNWFMSFLLCRRDPERGWDRSKVKGLLANLITVHDVSYATGLEVVAGGRLYNIVVDTEVGVLEGSVHLISVQPCLGVCVISFADLWDSVTRVGDVILSLPGDRQKTVGEGRAAAEVHHYSPEQDLCQDTQ